MSQIIHGQVLFLLASLCSGMLVMAGYEVVRLLRFLFRHNTIVKWVEDILYWGIAAVPVFYMFFYFNDGDIRWYGILMIICGAYIYYVGISRPVRILVKKIIDKFVKRV